MEVYVKIEFPTEVCRYGTKSATVNSEQYISRILSVSDLSLNIGDDHSFEISNIDIVFDDIDNHFRNKFSDAINKDIQGSRVIFYNSSGTKLTTLKIWSYIFLPNSRFSITCTNKFGELTNDFTEKITFEEFPSTSSVDSVGEVIPDCYGEMAAASAGGTVKCWQVEANKYLINSTVVAGSSIDAAYLEDGTDITASCVLSTTADGLRQVVNYSVTNPHFIVCDFTIGTYKSNNVQNVLAANLAKWVTFNSGNYTPNAALDTFFGGWGANSSFRYYANTAEKTGEELLKDFCDSHNVDWITNSDNEIEIKYIDINNLTSSYSIQDNKASEMPFSSSVDPEEYANKILMQGHFNDYTQSYQKQFEFNEFQSQSMYGIKPANISAKFLKVDELIVWASKYYAMFNKNPRQRAFTSMHIDDYFGNGLEPGDLIDFAHPDDRLKGGSSILYQIRKVSISFEGNMVNLELWDIDYLKNINTEINLLVQPNVSNNYLDYYDMSMTLDGNGNHILAPQLSILNSNTQVLFGNASCYAWGFRRITTPNHVNWDIVNSTTESATLSCYLYVNDLGNTYTYAQPIFEHYQNDNNRWGLQLQANGVLGSTGKLQFFITSGGVPIINIAGTTALATGQWYHVAMCKNASDIGIYINGVQEAYATLANPYNFTGLLYLFGNNARTTPAYLQAYVAEAFLSNDNFYSAAPVVGVTDVVTPFWQPLTQEATNKTLTTYNPRTGDTWTIGNIYRVKWNVPGLNTVIELWDSSGAGGAWVADLGTATNKQYIDIDTTGLAAADRTIRVSDADGNIEAWSGVFTLAV